MSEHGMNIAASPAREGEIPARRRVVRVRVRIEQAWKRNQCETRLCGHSGTSEMRPTKERNAR